MSFSDPKRQAQREIERRLAHQRWRLLRDFFDYGNGEDFPVHYREQFALPLAVQRTLPGVLDRVEDGTLAPNRFKPTWLEWAEAIATELPSGLVVPRG